jgi:DNA repair exonuclease SbcCD ATPase subunit
MSRRALSMLVFVAVFAAGVSSAAVWGQEENAPVKDDVKRLPPYFKDIVNEKQKGDIYKAQASFDKQLEGLEARYKELSEEMKTIRLQIDGIKDKERVALEAILTPQQVAKIKKLKAEAQSRIAQELLKAAEEAAKRAEELSATE